MAPPDAGARSGDSGVSMGNSGDNFFNPASFDMKAIRDRTIKMSIDQSLRPYDIGNFVSPLANIGVEVSKCLSLGPCNRGSHWELVVSDFFSEFWKGRKSIQSRAISRSSGLQDPNPF